MFGYLGLTPKSDDPGSFVVAKSKPSLKLEVGAQDLRKNVNLNTGR